MAETDTSNEAYETGSPAIRAAVAADVPAIAALDARITGLEKPEYWKDLFARYGNRPQRFFLVNTAANGHLLGFIIGEVRVWEFGSAPCGWIFAMGVDPDTRLQRVGSHLFEAMCSCLAKTGVTTVRTMLARDDELNMAFFRSQGMTGGPFIQLDMPLGDFMPDADGQQGGAR